mgnify:CR=1 FL=1
MDRLVEYTGLEIAGWILAPGKWVHAKTAATWDRYIDLANVEAENRRLHSKVEEMQLKVVRLEKEAAVAKRLRRLLKFKPPKGWETEGVRVIAHRLGPNAALKTLLINKGSENGVAINTPTLTPQGMVGKVIRVSPHFSTVLLLTDPNSRIAVVGKKSRTSGILCGQGPKALLQVKYIPQNDPLHEGEILVTSGLANIFPKGVPVAKVSKIEHSKLSLFQRVLAKPMVHFRNQEELLLLYRQAKKKDLQPREKE